MEFTWKPDLGAKRAIEPKVNVTEFNGYEARTPTSINSKFRAWDCTFTRVLAEAEAIEQFLNQAGAVTPFSWTDPKGDTALYVCRSWTMRQANFGLFEVVATFNEVGRLMHKIPTVEIQSLSRTALVELYAIDTTRLGGDIVYFHSGVSNSGQPIVWQGVTYQPLPIESEGFDISSQGTLPTPKLRVANVHGFFSALTMELEGLIGAKLIRKRTFGRYLDAVNFADGNPEADPNNHYPDQLWFIDRKLNESKFMIEWQLCSAFDLMGVQLPFGQVIKGSCRWRYRSAECGWTGSTYFDKNDKPTSNPDSDRCGKRINSCECRFGQNVVLPYGGFPGGATPVMNNDLELQMRSFGAEVYPNEACGFVVQISKNKSKLVMCQNDALNPQVEFIINPDEYDRAEEMGEIIGVWHTHTNGDAKPSSADLAGCEASGLTWYLCNVHKDSQDQFHFSNTCVFAPTGYEQPYLGRPYIYGSFDCWTLCKDFYKREFGIELGDYPRVANFWRDEQLNYFHTKWEEVGLVDVRGQELQRGDILFFQTDNSGNPNHSAVYIGNETILHHHVGRLSERSLYGGYWLKHTVKHLRYKNHVN